MVTIGGYELVGKVADTSSGAVWKGRDPKLDRDVALKQMVIRSNDLSALKDEARLLAALDHPDLVTVYDYIEEDGSGWLIEEWIEGAPLDTVIQFAGQLSPEQSVGVICGALEGLAYAHSCDLVHGDVAPGLRNGLEYPALPDTSARRH
jgi:serine/threonine protein kinase